MSDPSQATSLNPKLAPQDLEAERAVLAFILTSNDAILEVGPLRADDFYRSAHTKIFEAMLALSQAGQPIDPITLADELRRKEHLEDIGGVAYLATLDSATPPTASIAPYAKIVNNKARSRRVIQAAHEIAREGYEQAMDTDAYISRAIQKLSDATESAGVTNELEPIGDIVKRTFDELETLHERQNPITGVPCGLDELDRLTSGFQNSDLILIAARPAVGKTAIVLNMAAHVAIVQRLPVAMYSLEMSKTQLMRRLFSSDAMIPGDRLRSGMMADGDWPKLARSADKWFKANMYVSDSCATNIQDIRSACRKLKRRKGALGLVVVDYLQLMGQDIRDHEQREQVVAQFSRGLKLLAREINAPVIALSQLNRSVEKREDKRPMLSDLRESGSLEQDADMVIFLYRDDVYHTDSREKGTAEAIIAKQRNGSCGTVRVAFHKEFTRFDNLPDGWQPTPAPEPERRQRRYTNGARRDDN